MKLIRRQDYDHGYPWEWAVTRNGESNVLWEADVMLVSGSGCVSLKYIQFLKSYQVKLKILLLIENYISI